MRGEIVRRKRNLRFKNSKERGTPDILVTNYSMLEYMLMRPIEHAFWNNTKKWLENARKIGKNRKLLLILDESHLYEGAMGTEVSMLLNRLRAVINANDEDIQFILTSASLGKESDNEVPPQEDDKLKFVAGLTGVRGLTESGELSQEEWPCKHIREQFTMPKGIREEMFDHTLANDDESFSELCNAFSELSRTQFDEPNQQVIKLWSMLDDSSELPRFDEMKEDEIQIVVSNSWYDRLSHSKLFKKFYTILNQPDLLLVSNRNTRSEVK